MFERIITNWKPTVAGLVLGFGQYLVNQGESGFTWPSFAGVIGTILLGALSYQKPKVK